MILYCVERFQASLLDRVGFLASLEMQESACLETQHLLELLLTAGHNDAGIVL